MWHRGRHDFVHTFNQVKRVLLTGMSGTGKSSVIRALASRGYKAVDTAYDGWSHLVDVLPGASAGGRATQDWLWREDGIAELLATDDVDVLLISGAASSRWRCC